MPYLVAACCLNEGGWDLLTICFDFIKRWCICLKEQNSLYSAFFQLLFGWKGEEKAIRKELKSQGNARVSQARTAKFAGTYSTAASSFLVRGFPVWVFGDHCWADQVTQKGGDRKSGSQGEVLEGPPYSSFVEGLGVNTAQVSWEILKDTFSLIVVGLIKIQKFSLHTLFLLQELPSSDTWTWINRGRFHKCFINPWGTCPAPGCQHPALCMETGCGRPKKASVQ